jgi:hypothetical protein
VLAASVTSYADELAESIGGFFVAAGVDPAVGAAALERAAKRVRTGEASLQANEREPWIQLSDAIAMWWRDAEYVTDEGRPRPLPDTGPAPSLEALFERTVDAPLRSRARDLLRRRAAVERDGVWEYTDDQGTLRLGRKEGVHRLLTGLTGLLRTYLHNQTHGVQPPHLQNFDRTSHVSDFPESALPELRLKLYKRMQVVLEEFDEWMTKMARRHHGGPVVRVSIAAFMHAGSPRGGTVRQGDPRDDADATDRPQAAASLGEHL